MRGPTNDPYEQLLREWQAKREVVNVYYRALCLLVPALADAPQWEQARRRELNEKLEFALIALLQTSDQLRHYEQERVAEHLLAQMDTGERTC